MENFIIGLDEFRTVLFVILKTEGKYDAQIIHLRNVKSCSKKKIYRTNLLTIAKQKVKAYKFQ